MASKEDRSTRPRLSEIGKELRKLRIDQDGELMGHMAKKLGISAAFLSAVETGGKAPPQGFADLVSKAYGLGEFQQAALNRAEAHSRKSFVLTPVGADAKETIQALARRIDELPPEALRRIREIADKDREPK